MGEDQKPLTTKDPPASNEPPQLVEQRIALLEPIGEVFVNGLSNSYNDEYPEDYDPESKRLHFSKYMDKKEFSLAINKINDALLDHWPCMPCTTFAFGCCLCTLGGSFYCATTQVQEAEMRVKLQIRRINDQLNFKSRNVKWRLVRTWYKRQSYVEIIVITTASQQEEMSKTGSITSVDTQVMDRTISEITQETQTSESTWSVDAQDADRGFK